jgi:hypothetical protein
LQPEARLVHQIVAYLTKEYPHAQIRKRHGSAFSTAGDPDLYLCLNGRHIEIEVKLPGQSPTPLQRERLVKWGQAGAFCFVAHSITELKLMLEPMVLTGSDRF